MSYYDSLVNKDEQEAIALRGIPPHAFATQESSDPQSDRPLKKRGFEADSTGQTGQTFMITKGYDEGAG